MHPLPLSLLFLVMLSGSGCGPNRAYVEYLKGNEAFESMDHEKAMAHYNESLALDSSNAEAYLGRGRIHWLFLQHKQVVPNMTRALELDPNLAWAYYFRGISLMNLNDLEAGIDDLTGSLATNALPDDFRLRALHFRGIGYMNLARYDAAINDLDACIALDPDQPLYRFERGTLYEASGRADAAIGDYEAFLAQSFDENERTEQVRAKLGVLRGTLE